MFSEWGIVEQGMGVGKKFLFLGVILALLLCSPQHSGVTIFCAGDSMTDSEYPRHLRRIFSQEGRPFRVLNYGRKGNNSGQYLRFLKEQKSLLAQTRPDFVLLQLGTNDVRVDGDFTSAEDFAGQMKAIIGIFHEFRNCGGGKTRILLGLIPPIPEGVSSPFSPRSRERVSQEINPLLEKIAVEEDVVLVDNYSFFLTRPQLLSGIHPTSQGYKALAQNWHDALKPLLGKPQRNAKPSLFPRSFCPGIGACHGFPPTSSRSILLITLTKILEASNAPVVGGPPGRVTLSGPHSQYHGNGVSCNCVSDIEVFFKTC